jgi:formylglycine-generating enzyme required for sulfatase activity
MEFARVPAGKSWLGGGADKPGDREVEFKDDFYLGVYEVTQEQWQQLMGNNPSILTRTGPGKDAIKAVSDDDLKKFPVDSVNWYDAQRFIAELNKRDQQSGWTYRLPTEAEWEYACRAGSRSAFSTGDEITPAKACYLYNENGRRVGIGGRTPAGHYAGNAFGLCDLHGNVNEWMQDTWHPDYGGAPNDGRAWIAEGDDRRVMRGGAWDYLPRLLRSSWRDWRPAEERADNLGFRVVTSDSKTQRPA